MGGGGWVYWERILDPQCWTGKGHSREQGRGSPELRVYIYMDLFSKEQLSAELQHAVTEDLQTKAERLFNSNNRQFFFLQ